MGAETGAHQVLKSSEELKREGMRKLSSDHSSSSRFCSGVPASRRAGGQQEGRGGLWDCGVGWRGNLRPVS